jgi:hypothetical protein
MKRSILATCLVLAAGLGIGCMQAPAGEAYRLTVKLDSCYNRGIVLETPVAVDRPFSLTKLNGAVTNTISGVLKPPVDGKFPLDLTVSEWESAKSNIRGTTALNLELDKPWSGGVGFSFVYGRTVTLSKAGP